MIRLILFSAVVAFACNFDCESRKVAALERIAAALEEMNKNNNCHSNSILSNSYKAPEPTIKKTYDIKINGRSLRAEPTTNIDCIEECMMEYPPSRRETCVEEKCGVNND